MILIGHDGREFPLDGTDGFVLIDEVEGLSSGDVEIVSDTAVGRQGEVLRHVHLPAREVDLPVLVEASSRDELWPKVGGFRAALNPTRGDVALRFGDRELVARMADSSERTVGTCQRMVIVLRALDPYWRDAAEQQVRFELDPPQFFPVPPLEVRLNVLSGEVAITNSGDALAWPVWRLRGPCEAPVVLSRNGGAELVLDRPIGAGEEVTIDARPGAKTVRSSVDGSIYRHLTAASELWPLVAGSQTVSVSMPEAGSDARAILTYRRRWLSP